MAGLEKEGKVFSTKSSSDLIPKMPPDFVGLPYLYLNGENLEYYRNIEYLKEVTRQAVALLDRSNARYKNILDDKKLGYRIRALSSDGGKASSAEVEGICKKCGLAHGADFCIVQQIIDSEKYNEGEKVVPKMSKSSWSGVTSLDSRSIKKPDSTRISPTTCDPRQRVWQGIDITRKMSKIEKLDTHETICARYGQSAGRRFLMVNSMLHPPSKVFEKRRSAPQLDQIQTSVLRNSQNFDIIRDCPTQIKKKYDPLCPQLSPNVTEKMKMILNLQPPCNTQPWDINKNWKAVFQKHPKPKKTESTYSNPDNDDELSSSYVDKICKCRAQLCTCYEETCEAPELEKKCLLLNYENDIANNHLLTIRKKLWQAREARRQETITSKASFGVPVKNDRAESKQFHDKAKEEQIKLIKNCLSNNIARASYDEDELDKHIEEIANAAAPNINITQNRQWDSWLVQMKENERIYGSDEADSVSSEIMSDCSKESLISHSTDLNVERIKPSYIPHAKDMYDLIDNLFDKISLKFEKSLVKNSRKMRRLIYKPNFANVHGKMKLLGPTKTVFHEIMQLIKFDEYRKQLTPFNVIRDRKLKRLRGLEKKIDCKQRHRDITHGVQFGKKYRRCRPYRNYTEETGYKGFTPRERQMMDVSTFNRFTKFNAFHHPRKPITRKNMQHDFWLFCSMFHGADEACREDLMDPGMRLRFQEFQEMMNAKLPQPPLSETDDEVGSHQLLGHLFPEKEDAQVLQMGKTTPNSTHEQLPQDGLHKEAVAYAKSMNLGRSAGNLNNEEPRNVKLRHTGIAMPQKCLATNTQRRKHNKIVEEVRFNRDSKGSEKVCCSVKSLTNLLPLLKRIGTQPIDKDFHNTRKNGGAQEDTAITKTVSTNKRCSTVTKLSESKGQLMRNCKIVQSKASGRSLPLIRRKESVENIKPDSKRSSVKGLLRKTSMLNEKPVKTISSAIGMTPGQGPISLGGKKPKPCTSTVRIPSVNNQSNVKAWH